MVARPINVELLLVARELWAATNIAGEQAFLKLSVVPWTNAPQAVEKALIISLWCFLTEASC